MPPTARSNRPPPRISVTIGQYMKTRGYIHPPNTPYAGKPNLQLLCAMTGMGYSQLYRVLFAKNASDNGVTLRTIGRLCDALGCRPEDLIAYTPPDPSDIPTPVGPQHAVGEDTLEPVW